MSEVDDSGWVFDSLVGFLQGPIWSSPLLTFIEERSIIFESDVEDRKEYHEAYQEYKNLVDLLLGCYMEDMGITPHQFERACLINRHIKMPIKFQQSLFEQIWAANEYEIFKKMMIQKNLELQLQALSMIEQKFGLMPASLTCETGDGGLHEELVMEELLDKNVNADDAADNKTDCAEKHAILSEECEKGENVVENKPETTTEPVESFVNETKETKVKWDIGGDTFEPKPLKKLTPLASIATTEDADNATASETTEDIKKREDYLKDRRDQLLALKKQARCQYLEKMAQKRPSSARSIAEASMKGEDTQRPDSSIIQVRKALAARLKAEVVDS